MIAAPPNLTQLVPPGLVPMLPLALAGLILVLLFRKRRVAPGAAALCVLAGVLIALSTAAGPAISQALASVSGGLLP